MATTMLGVVVWFGVVSSAFGYEASGGTYRLQGGVVGSVGGDSSSTTYGATSTGGEPFIGPGSSTTFRVGAGSVQQLDRGITISVDDTTLDLPLASPGVTVSAQTTIQVRADSVGYSLSASQDHDLLHTDAVTTIPSFTGTVASPAPWSDLSSIGLGFSVSGGAGVDAKWGMSPNLNFAGFPTVAQEIHAKAGYQETVDSTSIDYRLRTAPTQAGGTYSNVVTYTVTPRV